MSPEQCQPDSALTFASDIYSLGVVLFYLLSSRYTRDVHADRKDLVDQIRSNYIAWCVLPEETPAELRAILERMLATDPAQRYADTAELAHDLEYYIYRDGYGPTIVTLAQYMAELMPGRFTFAGDDSEAKTEVLPTEFFSTVTDVTKTMRL
ncbi:Serine/threonine-protein kinase PknD [bioreactor metagenome]|uniref:Serine/threonine-protein kinase PknD n=1 Tax=bioreactor metagenome TaxID=1076179 RepID=A0A645H8A2_9ZZZZ